MGFRKRRHLLYLNVAPAGGLAQAMSYARWRGGKTRGKRGGTVHSVSLGARHGMRGEKLGVEPDLK